MRIPKVSIIVPCFNQAQYLDVCLQSVLDQTYTNWECIIVNDGSLDHTEELAMEWCKKHERFVYLKKENGGLSSARNSGIENARGEYILPLDADDKISPDYISLAIDSFVMDPFLTVVYCKAEKFGAEQGSCDLAPFSLKALACDNMIFCTAMFKKENWRLAGGYDCNMLYGWEDWEFWIALLKSGGKVNCIEKVCFYYRIKEVSMLKKMNFDQMKHLLEYMSVKHADFFVKQLGSFHHLNHLIVQSRKQQLDKLKSKKYVIDVFCKTFLRFSFFGTYK